MTHEKSQQESDSCQYQYRDLVLTTEPDERLGLPMRRYWWTLKRYIWYLSVLGFRGFISRQLSSTRMCRYIVKNRKSGDRVEKSDTLDLKPGELVEVRSMKEIFTTLDTQGKLKGLRFTPEMAKFCEKRFRVYKKVDKILLETTGELRRIRTPTVLLSGTFCDGSSHGGCNRSCFCFWREKWLRRVTFQSLKPNDNQLTCDTI